MPIQIRVTRELDDEFIGDVLVTAFDGSYGGCWETWAEPMHEKTEQWPHDRMLTLDEDENWTAVHIRCSDTDGLTATEIGLVTDGIVVNAEAIRVGIQRILDDNIVNSEIRDYVVRAVLEHDAGDIDATAADCIVQAGVFGRVIWG